MLDFTTSRKTADEVSTASRKTGRARGYIEDYRPQSKTLELIHDAQAVLQEYREHWPLTIRQIYYRLIGAHGYEKTEAFYGRLCHHLANARRGRMISFSAIRDDGVVTVPFEHFDDADDFRAMVRRKANRYRRNLMANQDFHVEVWCEAAGMIQQLAEVTEHYSIPVYSSSGFDSLTAKQELASRVCRIGKDAIILHLGDFDPSGEAMFDVIAEDVGSFVKYDRPWHMEVQFRRVTLTAAQVEKYSLPTAPAKSSDTRSKRWIGETCQLEALAPDQIAALLRQEIDDIVSHSQMATDLEEEQRERQQLTRLLPAPGAAA